VLRFWKEARKHLSTVKISMNIDVRIAF